MKIPETSANVGAYYGNEENGQWQPNGVIIDSGVGGGVVGSGDAGIHRPPVYPVHIPRGHIPGYVMAGAFYPPAPQFAAPAQPDDFEDYMWMENEEEFDKQVMQQLEEEALMEQCIEAMLEDEQRERHRPVNGHNKHYPTTSNGNPLSLEETVSRSTLNPLAAEFVPTGARQSTAPPPGERPDSPEVPSTSVAEESKSAAPEVEPEPTAESPPAPEPEHTTEEPTPQTETPEVSAADAQTQDKDKRPKDKKEVKKKEEPKKLVKQDSKPKAKPVTVKSEPKVVKKKEVKPVKSEAKVEETVEAPKPAQPVEEPSIGPKPINYAAAAKANKPKKPTSPPPLKVEKKVEKADKTAPKEKTLPRKNSAK